MSLFFFVIGAWAISLLGSFLLDFIQKRAKKQTHEQSFQSLPFSFFVLSPHLSLSPLVTKLPVNSSAQALQASSDFYGCETWTLLADSEKRIQDFGTKCPRKTSPHLLLVTKDQRPGAERDQLPSESTGTSSGIRACYTPQWPLQNHSSGRLWEWATPWSAEEMLDGQHQRVDIPAHGRTAHDDLPKKRLEVDLC